MPFFQTLATLFFKPVSLFPTSTSFVLFEVTFLIKVFSISSKSVFSRKTSISVLVAKFVCFNFAAKFADGNL